MCQSGQLFNVSEWTVVYCVRVDSCLMCQSGQLFNVSEWTVV